MGWLKTKCLLAYAAMFRWCAMARDALRRKLRQTEGQGTTEYAILVGVLVVIAILAIALFRPRIQELWDAIATGINSL